MKKKGKWRGNLGLEVVQWGLFGVVFIIVFEPKKQKHKRANKKNKTNQDYENTIHNNSYSQRSG